MSVLRFLQSFQSFLSPSSIRKKICKCSLFATTWKVYALIEQADAKNRLFGDFSAAQFGGAAPRYRDLTALWT